MFYFTRNHGLTDCQLLTVVFIVFAALYHFNHWWLHSSKYLILLPTRLAVEKVLWCSVSVCVCVWVCLYGLPSHECALQGRFSLGGEGNVLYLVISSLMLIQLIIAKLNKRQKESRRPTWERNIDDLKWWQDFCFLYWLFSCHFTHTYGHTHTHTQTQTHIQKDFVYLTVITILFVLLFTCTFKSKCLPILYYGLEVCRFTKSQIDALQYVVISCFGKIFNTKLRDLIWHTCLQEQSDMTPYKCFKKGAWPGLRFRALNANSSKMVKATDFKSGMAVSRDIPDMKP